MRLNPFDLAAISAGIIAAILLLHWIVTSIRSILRRRATQRHARELRADYESTI